MDNIILSLLLIKSMTAYELKMFIRKTLSTVCSDSLGSIQSVLKKLEKRNCVEVHERIENNVFKREYSITKEGLKQFNEWICVPMDIHKAKNIEEGKFFFLGFAPKEVRINSLKGYIDSLVLEQKKIEELRAIVESTKDFAIEQNKIRISQEAHLKEDILHVSSGDTLEQVIKNEWEYQVYNLEYAEKRLHEDIAFYRMILERECNKKI